MYSFFAWVIHDAWFNGESTLRWSALGVSAFLGSWWADFLTLNTFLLPFAYITPSNLIIITLDWITYHPFHLTGFRGNAIFLHLPAWCLSLWHINYSHRNLKALRTPWYVGKTCLNFYFFFWVFSSLSLLLTFLPVTSLCVLSHTKVYTLRICSSLLGVTRLSVPFDLLFFLVHCVSLLYDLAMQCVTFFNALWNHAWLP